VLKAGKWPQSQLDSDFVSRWAVVGGRDDPLTPGKISGRRCEQRVTPDIVAPVAMLSLEPATRFLSEKTGTLRIHFTDEQAVQVSGLNLSSLLFQPPVPVIYSLLSDLEALPMDYFLRFTPSPEGTYTVNLPSGSVRDDSGNINTAAAELQFVYDYTAPTVDIQQIPSVDNRRDTIQIVCKDTVAGVDIIYTQ